MNSFLAGYVGFPRELLETSGTHVVPFQSPNHMGIHIFRREGLCLVSTTRERLEEVRTISSEPPDPAFDEQFLTKAFPTITKITGPNLSHGFGLPGVRQDALYQAPAVRGRAARFTTTSWSTSVKWRNRVTPIRARHRSWSGSH
jgi:hypothetical protein